MKVLIADSGSTKCDWLAITEHGQELHEFHTMGFNPYFHDADLVEREMKEFPGHVHGGVCRSCLFLRCRIEFARTCRSSQRDCGACLCTQKSMWGTTSMGRHTATGRTGGDVHSWHGQQQLHV